MHFAQFCDVKEKNGLDYPVHDVLSAQDIHNQMIIILFNCGVKWLPGIGVDSFALKDKAGKFVLVKMVKQFKSAIFPDSTMICAEGEQLPHPVDGSFIFMVAKKVGEAAAKRRALEVEKYKLANPNHSQPRLIGSGVVKKATSYNANIVKFKATELIGQILFQYFHMPCHEQLPLEESQQFKTSVNTHNCRKQDVVSTKMLKPDSSKAKGYIRLSNDEIWRVYKNF